MRFARAYMMVNEELPALLNPSKRVAHPAENNPAHRHDEEHRAQAEAEPAAAGSGHCGASLTP